MKTITLFTIKKCNYKCGNRVYGCSAGCQVHNSQTGIKLDFQKAVEWLNEYEPDALIHISGGEPFLHEGLKEGIELLFANNYDVTIFTNASLLSDNEWVYELPVKWHLTHHYFSVGIEEFLDSIEPLKVKPHILTRIFEKGTDPDPVIADLYKDFNFLWRESKGGYQGVVSINTGSCPNDTIMMINEYGIINPCSVPSSNFGNIHDMTYDKEAAKSYVCHAQRWPDLCPSRQTTQLMEAL